MQDAVAVLTGDIVDSTKAGPARTDRAIAALGETADTISQWVHHDTRFTRYRGDSWQLVIAARPGLAFRASLLLAARLAMSDADLATRISVGIGPIDRLHGPSLAGASGEAFQISGHDLDHMDRTRRLSISGRGVTGWHRASFEIADWMIRRWSREQAEAVAHSLEHDGEPLAGLGARIGITRQAFQARLVASGLTALDTALHAFETETFGEAAP
jgi:hypothetical protein